MIDLKFAFQSMIDRSGFDRSDRSFSRIVLPLVRTIIPNGSPSTVWANDNVLLIVVGQMGLN